MWNELYFYKGKSISDYCRENGLNSKSIKMRIFRLKQKEECKNCTPDELVEMAMAMENKTKYYYKDDSLLQYCKKNNISYTTIKHRLERLRKRFKYDDNQLIEMALNDKWRKKPINYTKFCQDNNLDYISTKRKLNRLKTREFLFEYSELELLKIASDDYLYTIYYNEEIFKYVDENKINIEELIKVTKVLQGKPKCGSLGKKRLLEVAIIYCLKRENDKKDYSKKK